MTVDQHFAEQSVRFLRSVKSLYGKNVGVDVLNALQPILGKDWAGQVVFDILADNFKAYDFIMVDFNQVEKKINAIKEIRQINYDFGLKEAKDFVEMNDGAGPVRLPVRPSRSYGMSDTEYEAECKRVAHDGVRNLNTLVGVHAYGV